MPRTKFSASDIDYINRNYNKNTEQLATDLDCSEELVVEYLQSFVLPETEESKPKNNNLDKLGRRSGAVVMTKAASEMGDEVRPDKLENNPKFRNSVYKPMDK